MSKVACVKEQKHEIKGELRWNGNYLASACCGWRYKYRNEEYREDDSDNTTIGK